MAARVYFFRNGKELVNHPANGLPLVGCGANHAKWATKSDKSKGKPVGTLGATDALEVAKGRVTYAVRPSDFDEAVMVKMWWGPGHEEFRAFCSLEDAVAKGAVATGHTNNHWAEDGRGVDFQGWAPFSVYLEGLAK